MTKEEMMAALEGLFGKNPDERRESAKRLVIGAVQYAGQKVLEGPGAVAEPPPVGNCVECVYFNEDEEACHRYPPAHVDTHDHIRIVHPEVHPDDWCGEFKPAESWEEEEEA